jgi:inner membrane protein
MSPITHFLAGWAVANAAKLNKRERMLVALAGVAPDVDGIGVVWDVLSRSGSYEFYQKYHHVFGHNIFFGLLVAAFGLLLGVRKGLVAALMLVSFHLHLLGDIVGARGLENDFWAVPYFWPLSSRDYYWSGQWPLNGWQNFVITGILMALTFFWAWKRGYSPIEMVSQKADQAFVDTLRRRFSRISFGQ